MEIIVHKDLAKLKTKYEHLYNNSPYKNVFMSYDFLQNHLQTINYHKFLRFLKNKSKIRFLEVVNNGETVLLLPVEIFKNKIKPIPTFDYYDILFGNFDNQVLIEALYAIMEQYQSDLTFYNVAERAKLYELAGSVPAAEILLPPHGCGAIELPDSYEDYYQSLTKSSRQNIRTAYNRLTKDNLPIKMDYYLGNVPKKVYKQARRMYTKRFFEKNQNKRSLLKGLMLRLFEPISKICYATKDSFHAVLTINNRPAAVMAGLISDQRVIIPRLVYNSDFGKYSPGILLINETVKYIMQEKLFKVLDLGYGEESYKFVMGGGYYWVHDISIKRE